ncbi:hypothetical protein P7C70_g5046, partial [Phenoliferia sp. Uapishka_3]
MPEPLLVLVARDPEYLQAPYVMAPYMHEAWTRDYGEGCPEAPTRVKGRTQGALRRFQFQVCEGDKGWLSDVTPAATPHWAWDLPLTLARDLKCLFECPLVLWPHFRCSHTVEELEAMGLVDNPASPVHIIPPEFLEASRTTQSSGHPGLRAGMAASFANNRSFARVVAVKKTSLREQADIERTIDLGRRYPLPLYKVDAPLIFAATRPVVERGASGKGPYVEVANIPLGELPKWFAELGYDFGADKYYHSKAVVSKHLGPSGDQMFNPAIRVPLFHWNPLVPAHVIQEFASKGTKSHPHGVKEVFRAFYSCNRACQKFCLGKNQNGRKVYTHVDRTSRGEELKCQTKIKIVVRADNLQNAIIMQRGTHQGRTVKVELLETSRMLRAYARDQCERLGMTVSTVAQQMIDVVHNWEVDSLFELPLWRRISTVDIKGIFRARSIRNGMIGDPLVALESLSQSRHYDPETMKGNDERGFVFFQPYIPPLEPEPGDKKAKSKFRTPGKNVGNTKTTSFAKKPKVKNAKALQSLLAVLASASCCDDIIRWARVNGIGIDSSHRHKCENRAPMTIMCTMADDGHVRIAHKLGRPIGRDEADQAQLLAEAIIIDKEGWKPSHVMIDKSRSELNAIRTWADAMGIDVNIRLCQFHIIQAILRWSADSPGAPDRTKKKDIKITRLAKLEILDAFRALQRYRSAQGATESDAAFSIRSEDEWKVAVTLFASRINDLSDWYAEGDESLLWYDKVISYFEENWFTPEWRDLWVNHGMPPGQTRDGIWGTNNRTERLFRFFDDVLLGGTCNRRIDHLPLIIIDTLFPYFANFTSTNDTIDETLLTTLDLAAEYWESVHFERDLDFPRAFWVTPLGASDSYLANLTVGECPCTVFAATGKRCSHMWAADFQDLNGDYENYNAISGRNFRDQKRSATVPPREPEPWRELTDRTVKNLSTLVFSRPRWKDTRPGHNAESLSAAAEASLDEEREQDDYRTADVDEADELLASPGGRGSTRTTDQSTSFPGNDETEDEGPPTEDEGRATARMDGSQAQAEKHAEPVARLPTPRAQGHVPAGLEREDEYDHEYEANESAEEALADEEQGGADDFIAYPKIHVKTSLPSAGAARGIKKVVIIRGSDRSALKERPKKKNQRTTVFTQKSGPKRPDKGHNSLSTQVDLDKLSEAKSKRARQKTTAPSEPSHPPDGLVNPGPSRPTPRPSKFRPGLIIPSPSVSPEPPSSLYNGPARIPNSLRRPPPEGSPASLASTARAAKTSPGKATADRVNSRREVSPVHDAVVPPRRAPVEPSREAVQDAWCAREAILDVAYFDDYPFASPVTGYSDFHPDGRAYWNRFHDTSEAQRTAVTNAFLQQFDDLLTPKKVPLHLSAAPRARVHLTPITTSSGPYRVSPTTMWQVYQMNEWLDCLNMNAALSALNFWLEHQNARLTTLVMPPACDPSTIELDNSSDEDPSADGTSRKSATQDPRLPGEQISSANASSTRVPPVQAEEAEDEADPKSSTRNEERKGRSGSVLEVSPEAFSAKVKVTLTSGLPHPTASSPSAKTAPHAGSDEHEKDPFLDNVASTGDERPLVPPVIHAKRPHAHVTFSPSALQDLSYADNSRRLSREPSASPLPSASPPPPRLPVPVHQPQPSVPSRTRLPGLNPRLHPITAPLPRPRKLSSFTAPGRKTADGPCLTRLRPPAGSSQSRARLQSQQRESSSAAESSSASEQDNMATTNFTSDGDEVDDDDDDDDDEFENDVVSNSLVKPKPPPLSVEIHPPTVPRALGATHATTAHRPLLFHGPPRVSPAQDGDAGAKSKPKPKPKPKPTPKLKQKPKPAPKPKPPPKPLLKPSTSSKRPASEEADRGKTAKKVKTVQELLAATLVRVAELEAQAAAGSQRETASQTTRGKACAPCRKSKIRCPGGSPCAQ